MCLLHALSFGISGVLVALLCRAHYAFSPVCFAWASKASLLGIDIKVQSLSDAKFKSFPFVLETILKVESQSLWTHRMGARGGVRVSCLVSVSVWPQIKTTAASAYSRPRRSGPAPRVLSSAGCPGLWSPQALSLLADTFRKFTVFLNLQFWGFSL